MPNHEDNNDPTLTEEESQAPAEEAGGESPSADATAELLAKLDAAQQEAQEWRERFLRANADLENFRKRMARERDELRRFATEGLISELLPQLDNLDLGLKTACEQHPEATGYTEGFSMVLGQVRQVLANHGVEEINPLGEAFDPNLHEGVAHQPSEDHPEGHVSLVQRKGYRLRERLIRPATVVVSSGPAESAPEADTEN